MLKLSTIFTLLLLIISQSSFAKTIKVSNNTQLAAANKTAQPGDSIILKNGTWLDCKIEITCNGTASKPIVFKAQDAGKVAISGKSNLRISGNYIVVDGLEFINGYSPEGEVWQFKFGKQLGNNCRITNCKIDDFNVIKRLDEGYWVAFYGKNNRIDHSSFYSKKNMGVLMAVILDDNRSRQNSHSIDNNIFGIRVPLASNTGEIIRVGVSQHCTFYSNTVIKDNVFEYCDGEAEIISIKSCGNVIRNNVFKECQGSISLRHGNNNTVEGNIFIGNGKEGTGGVRIINEDNWVVNNLFYNCRGINFRSPLAIMNGVFNSPAFRYLPVRDAVVANNTFVNCTSFSLCEGSDSERTVTPKNVYFFNNIFLNKKDAVLYEVFDKIDSIFFSNNIVDNAIKQQLTKGFIKNNLSEASIATLSITSSVSNTFLPAFMATQTSSRLAYGLPKKVGFNRWDEYKKITANHYSFLNKNKGFHSVNKASLVINTQVDTIYKCQTEGDIIKALTIKKPNITIELTNINYTITQPLNIHNKVIISAKPNTFISFSSTNLPMCFLVNGNASLTLQNLQIDGNNIKATNFISLDTSGSCNHTGKFTIQFCKFINFTCNNMFIAPKTSVVDAIIITNTSFINNHCNLFNLNNETDNKGYYNVENMQVEQCTFINQEGAILNIYRGGNDESTLGPKLHFDNNSFIACNNIQALITLYGVQQSYFTNNHFINSNIGKTTISYIDKVRGLHVQKSNQFINSGTITENKFVVNMP